MEKGLCFGPMPTPVELLMKLPNCVGQQHMLFVQNQMPQQQLTKTGFEHLVGDRDET